MNKIVWLASYPKSGNTWLRTFFANLLSGADSPVSINSLGCIPNGSVRALFDEVVGVESSDLELLEIAALRPRAYSHLSDEHGDPMLVKIHDARWTTDTIPAYATARAIYIVRNPLDVAVSFSHHLGWATSRVVDKMCDEQFALCPSVTKCDDQLKQPLMNWSQHVTSWIDSADFDVLTIRYEDMHSAPLETFRRAANFAQLAHDPQRVGHAVAFSEFAELSRQEQEDGFREKAPAAERFFRDGRVGGGRESLTEGEVAKLLEHHGPVMSRLGYLADEGPASSATCTGE